MRQLIPPIDRFMSKIEMITESGCWLWTGCEHPATGYGRFGITSGEVEYAHRAAWRLFVGEIPDGLFVCHRCDTRMCAYWRHLFLGSPTDNMRDCATKGRIVMPSENRSSSEDHQVAILTNAQVVEIRNSPLTAWKLAKLNLYPVGYHAILLAKTGRTFRDVNA